MKAVQVTKFGSPDDVMTVQDNIPKPTPPKKNNKILIRVKACSLTPGDYRGLLGDKTVVANPPMPYVPGGDVCGVIEEIPETIKKEYDFQVGDAVVATWDIFGTGGLAQYAWIDPKLAVKLPSELSFVEGAALANSASHAHDILEKAKIRSGDRVLILGGSGGIGTLLVQMVRKLKNASYVGATSTDEDLMKRLGVDKTVNYQKEEFSQVKEWQKDKFDVVIDLAVGKRAWRDCRPIVKSCRQGGRWIAVVAQDWHIDGKHIYQIFQLLLPPMGRQLWNVFRMKSPYYRMYLGGATSTTMDSMMTMVAEKKIELVLDPQSPHSFTTQGVRDAWNLHIAKKGHGKIVILVD